MISIIECDTFDEYKKVMSNISFFSNTYPMLSGIVLTKLLETLEVQKIEYNLKKFNKNNYEISNIKDICLLHNLKITNNENVILTFGENEKYEWCSYLHAFLTRTKLYIFKNELEIKKFIKKSELKYITIIAEDKLITTKLISSIYNIQENKCKGEKIYSSFLTARDIFGLISIIIRNDLYKKNPISNALTVNRLEHNEKEIIKSKQIEIFPDKKSNIETLKNVLVNKNRNLFTAIGHGRDDIFWLYDNGAICGKTCYSNENLKENNKEKPSCYYTGKCFKKDIKILNAYNISSRHIFMNSCYGSKVEEGLFSNNFNLVYSFLDGHSVSYFGSSFMVEGEACMNYYYVAQIMSGVSIGLAATNVSRFYSNYKLGYEFAYFLIGDPTNKINTVYSILIFDIKLNDNKEYHQIYNIPKDCFLFSIKFKEKDIYQKFKEYKYSLEIISKKNPELYFIFRISDNIVFLDIFSSTIIKSDAIEVKIKKNIEIKLDIIRNFEAILGIGIYPNSKFKSLLIQTKENSLRISKDNKCWMWNIKKMKKMYIKKNDYKEKIFELSEIVLKYLLEQVHNKGYTWDDKCLSNGLVYNQLKIVTDKFCENCGKEIYLMDYQHKFYKELNRYYNCCSACGITKDIPYKFEKIDILIEGASTVYQGECIKQKIKIRNTYDSYLCGFVGMRIASGKENNISYIDDDIEKITLNNNELYEKEITIYFPIDVQPHNYWMYVNIILNGEILVLKKDIWVKSKIPKLQY